MLLVPFFDTNLSLDSRYLEGKATASINVETQNWLG